MEKRHMRILKEKVLEKDGRDIFQYSLINDLKMQVKILTLGGIITEIIVPDKNNNFENIVVNWDNLSEYLNDEGYTGAIVGRTAGRIADGQAIINGIKYEFNINNNGINQHHGGIEGFNKKLWEDTIEEKSDEVLLILEYFSRDGEENYPGNLKVKVIYSLNNKNEFSIMYNGKSDKDTLLNMTNHSYFNLSGNMKRNILDETLIINSDKVAAIRKDGALNGELFEVDKTPFDFRIPKKIGRDINKKNEQLILANGYDHPWIFRNEDDEFNVMLKDDKSGRILKVKTDFKSAMIYTTNFPANKILYGGRKLLKNDAICFETQNLSIGENSKFIEESILKKNENYKHKTTFKFTID
jgi:aldose 1-epimerase